MLTWQPPHSCRGISGGHSDIRRLWWIWKSVVIDHGMVNVTGWRPSTPPSVIGVRVGQRRRGPGHCTGRNHRSVHGCHLHFEVKRTDSMDPEQFLNGKPSPTPTIGIVDLTPPRPTTRPNHQPRARDDSAAVADINPTPAPTPTNTPTGYEPFGVHNRIRQKPVGPDRGGVRHRRSPPPRVSSPPRVAQLRLSPPGALLPPTELELGLQRPVRPVPRSRASGRMPPTAPSLPRPN